MPKLRIDELNKLYSEADLVDQDLFSEQRSNCLLVSGDHFNKRGSKFWQRLRDQKDVSSETKIRLTKNHVQKITKSYVANILNHAPSTAIMPNNEDELQDQKSAELHQAVWQYIRKKHSLRKKTRQWLEDLVTIGECAVKVFWDPNRGELIGYESEVDEFGQPVLDELGQPKASDRPVFSGDLVYERVFGFNLLRAPSAKAMEDSPYLIVRKMVKRDELKRQVEGMPSPDEKKRWLEDSKDETFVVFDAQKGAYQSTKDEVMVREYYFRPGPEYPNGYYYLAVSGGILFEGELPFGKFPIPYVPMDEIPTSPRGRSIIKQLRPYQAEINRAASMVAETQISIGSDKILIQSGTKIGSGGTLPGVRALTYTGMKPDILPGRSGDHLVEYIANQIQEMYSVAMLEEDRVERDGQLDAYALLFRSMRQKKRFSTYAEKFEDFLIGVTEISLELYRRYAPDNQIIPAIGRNESVNLIEFKNQNALCYQIKIENQGDDIETKLGKQIVLNQAIQYVGNKLEKEDIGKLIRAMPYGNFDESFSDLTIDYDSATNVILAMDRGDLPDVNKYDNHEYMIKRLVARSRMADFKMLSPQIQQAYAARIAEHSQSIQDNLLELKAAQSELIPTGGYMVTLDMYVPDPADPTKSRRARLPYEAVKDLIDRLERQGNSLQQLEAMNQANVADIARGMRSQLQSQQGVNGMTPALPPKEMGYGNG